MRRFQPVMIGFIYLSLLLLQALSVVAAEQNDDTTTSIIPNGQSEIVTSHDASHTYREPGADHVDLALAELRKIHQTTHHKRRRKSGFLGTILSYAWKAVPSLRISAPPQDTPAKAISGPLLEAVKHLETASHKNNSDALYLLGQINFYGNYSHPRDFKRSFNFYQQLATLNGNGSALYMLGFMYSTGVGGAVERDQARALLYYTFAAVRGHTRAEMTVGNRHHVGIGTPRSCESATKYYKRVADKVMDWYRSGPPGGMAWAREASRVADDLGGIYGEGASVSSSGINAIRASPNSDAYASIEDIIEYLDLMSNKGDFKASFNLGRIYYEGQRGLDRDLSMAKKYFFMVAKKYWKSNGRVDENFKPGLDKYAAKAAGFIGRMYMRGEGVEQHFDRAKFWFERGISHGGDAQSQYALGLMLLHGYGVDKNIAKATELFKASADQDYAFSQVELGVLYLDRGQPEDVRIANDYFELAARYHHIEAQYYLAEMIHYGIGRDKACAQALGYYKSVAEKAEPLVSSWTEANQAYDDGDHELALLGYLHAAEEGYEAAQNNVAYMLDPDQSILIKWLDQAASQKPHVLQNPSLALVYWTRSSKQGNIDSLVKMGDYYLNGIGTERDVDKAVQCYTGASEYHQSAQALFNLGWMHENGVGLNQDYHLAKRYYDNALTTNDEAYLPVTLSLLKLRMRSAWNTFTHGRINSIQDEPSKKKEWSLSEWVANFIKDEGMYYEMEFDDIYDDAMPGGDGPHITGEDDEGFMDTMIIMALALSLAFFIYYRHQREQAENARRRREQQQGGQNAPQAAPPAAQNNGGLFPPPGDPNFAQWAAGGVGH